MSGLFRLLMLCLAKLFSGDLSEWYFDAYRKYLKKRPMTSIRIKQCYGSEAVLHLDKVFVVDEKIQLKPTPQAIIFEGIPFGKLVKTIKKEHRPFICAKHEQYGDNKLQVLGYRKQIGNQTMRANFYFLNKVFFMGEYLTVKTTETGAQQLFNALMNDYRMDHEPYCDKLYLEGSNRSRILFLNDGVNVQMRYFQPSQPGIHEALSQMISPTLFPNGQKA